MIRLGLRSEQFCQGKLVPNSKLVHNYKMPKTAADEEEERKGNIRGLNSRIGRLEHRWYREYQELAYDAAKADCYALGCLMLELASGEHPYPLVVKQDPVDVVSLVWRFRLYPKRCRKSLSDSHQAGFDVAAYLLHPDPAKRWTPLQVLQDKWINTQFSKGRG